MAVKKKSKKTAPKKQAKSKAPSKNKSKSAPKKKAAAKKIKAKAAPQVKAKSKSAKVVSSKPSSLPKAAPADWGRLISPLEDRVIVRPDQRPDMTAGGLFIPGTADTGRPVRGQVLAAGRGRRNKKGQLRPLDVEVGDRVVYAEWAGTSAEIGGLEVLILREDEILAIEGSR